MNQAQTLRAMSGWAVIRLTDDAEWATSHLPLDEEYWLALRNPAEVETAGLALLTSRSAAFGALAPNEKGQLWREFQAYIRQAEGFYRGACVLPWKSSPLNYYYAFMNLAKALFVTRGLLPAQAVAQPRRIRHGLNAHVVPGAPDVWRLSTQGANEIFPMLYETVIGTPIAQHTTFDGRQLLGYVSPIGWQLTKSGAQIAQSWFPCKWILGQHAGQGCWDLICVPAQIDLARLPATFDAAYEEVPGQMVKHWAFTNLRLDASEASAHRFLQRQAPVPVQAPAQSDVPALRLNLTTEAVSCVFDYLGGSDYQLALSLPYQSAGQAVPMNEFISLYCITYFLSSLVRYHPDYMESIAASSDSWLIESFAKSAPFFLLKYFACAILGYPLLITAT